MNGLITSAKYAFMPNKLTYCGPDKNRDLFDYCVTGKQDQGLLNILEEFEMMYPYLKLIARGNAIREPFNPRVVEAYWIGNRLLQNVSMEQMYWHLKDDIRLKDKLAYKSLKLILGKIPIGAKPHHSFHVFNVFKRTGKLGIEHTIETMDNCRIGWGQVVEKQKGYLNISMKRLVLRHGKFALSKPETHKVIFSLNDKSFITNIKKADWISVHWNWVCDKLTLNQVRNLEKYTHHSINIANLTI